MPASGWRHAPHIAAAPSVLLPGLAAAWAPSAHVACHTHLRRCRQRGAALSSGDSCFAVVHPPPGLDLQWSQQQHASCLRPSIVIMRLCHAMQAPMYAQIAQAGQTRHGLSYGCPRRPMPMPCMHLQVIGKGSYGVVCSAVDNYTGERYGKCRVCVNCHVVCCVFALGSRVGPSPRTCRVNMPAHLTICACATRSCAAAIKKITNVFEHVSDATRILREIKLLRLLKHPGASIALLKGCAKGRGRRAGKEGHSWHCRGVLSGRGVVLGGWPLPSTPRQHTGAVHTPLHTDIVEIKHIMLPPNSKDFKDIYVVFELLETDLHQVPKACTGGGAPFSTGGPAMEAPWRGDEQQC